MAQETVQRPDGQMVAISGASRTGKTTAALQLSASDQRLLVWDNPGRDWPRAPGVQRITDRRTLLNLLAETIDGSSLRVSYGGPLNREEFAFFCRAALLWGKFAPATIVIEELADVTHAGKATPGWGDLSRGGLAYGINVVGITQRIQESDKTLAGNATVVRMFRPANRADAEHLGRLFDIEATELLGLGTGDFIQKHVGQPGHVRMSLPKIATA